MAKRTKKKSKTAPALPFDQKFAGDLRARMINALAPVAAILDEATQAGLSVGFSLEPGPDARNHVKHVTIARVL